MTNQIINPQKNIYLIPSAIIIAGIIIAGTVVYTKNLQPRAELSKKSGTDQVVSPEESQGGDQEAKFTITKNDHVRGNFEAPVTIVEFSDFQCPYCKRFHPTVQQILDDYPDQVRWVYKHFPLGFHEEAQPSAEASECAAEQKGNEGFWRFTDGLFENQSRLGQGLYKELASQIGLNMTQFENCLAVGKYRDHVQSDLQEGQIAGVRGTPGSFVNGEPVSGAVSYSTLRVAVEKALANL